MHTHVRQVLAKKGHEIHGVPLGTSISKAARTMNAHKIGSVVVWSGDEVVGILTERDLARRVCAGAIDLDATSVEQVMTAPVAFVTPGSTVAAAMKTMSETRCRHLPVLDGGKVVGLVSLGDLVRTVTNDLAADVKYLKDYIVRG